MTGAEMKAALAELGLMQQDGPRVFGKSARTVRRYCSGHDAIPPLVVEKVERLLAAKRGGRAA